ncbi:MAG: hypothetical protein LBU27_07010 [Candidatus Peribacteria bacterium]|jgi:hypothetical protein|nr:hypothetical protein [Candidatus Peribacteria bacterium]
MKQDLANELLSTIMDWESKDVEEYRERLEDIAELKYDRYQQYRPGGRFLENLTIWLNQFDELAEKKVAFDFLLQRLIFISPDELNHLVGMVFPDIIKLILKEESRKIQKEEELELSIEDKLVLLEVLRNESLFLGLSDGARIDVFRRLTSELNHEQICLSYEIPDSKYDDIMEAIIKQIDSMKLGEELKRIASPPSIRNIFLLDDFSASGISFIRQEKDDNGNKIWKGKISKLIKSFKGNGFNLSTIKVVIILYAATDSAITHIKDNLSEYNQENEIAMDFDVRAIQIVQPYQLSTKENALFKKYFDDCIIDSHYKKGKHEKPFLGFDECGLPIVLYHNTPNNSFPIIWSTDNALFPRVTRHKDV